MIEAEPTMLHPSDSIFVDRTALLQGLTVLRNAAADRTGEEAILSFEESSLVVEFGGGAVTIPTFGGWHLQIRVTGQTLLKLATVMPDRDPIELEVVDGGVRLRIGGVAIPCHLQPLGSKIIELPVNAEYEDIIRTLKPFSREQIEKSGLLQVLAFALDRERISKAAALLAPFAVTERDIIDLVERRKQGATSLKSTTELLLPCATSDHKGMSALANLDRKLAASDSEAFRISFSEENRSDSTFKCDSTFSAALGVVIARIQDRGRRFNFGVVPKIVKDLFIANWFLHGIGIADQPESLHSTRIPFQQFKTSEIDRFLDYLEQHLEGKGLPSLDSTFSLQLLQCLGEVFVNTETHSDSALGVFVCGQHYPAQQRLVLTIADAGVTIPARIAKRFGRNLSPVHALEWAMTKGHTTKQGTPGGIGLKLLRDFAREQRGEVWIASGRAFWELQSGVEKFSELDDPFPGTVVTLKIPTEPNPGAMPPELSVLSIPTPLSNE